MTSLTDGQDLLADIEGTPTPPEPERIGMRHEPDVTELDVVESVGDSGSVNGEPSPASGVPATGVGMSFQIRKFFMLALLEKASTAVPLKDIMPVLKNFQIEARPGRLRVVATDLELSVVSTVTMVSVTRPGIAVFPAKKMLEILREAEDEDLHLDVVDGVATLSVGRTNWTLRLQAGDDYPVLPEISQVHLHDVDRVRFLGGLRSVRYAAATDTVRPNLMMIDVTNGRMTACDGVRFQQAILGDNFPLSLQIPIGAVDDLFKLLNTTELAEIGIGESDFHLVFRIGSDVFIANKLMAQFPDVERMLLQPALRNQHVLTCDRSDLTDAVKRVRINADPETSAIVLQLTRDQVLLESRDKYGNASQETIDAGWSQGAKTLVVNHKFFTDLLGMYDGKSCKFLLGDDTKTRKTPVLLRDDDTGTVGIIQQMRHDHVTDLESAS